jgi:hypothetical protein
MSHQTSRPGPPTERVRVRRRAARASYERSVLNAILDQALVCHVGYLHDGQPYVTPTIHARVDETIYLHGQRGNRSLNTLASGAPVCVEATIGVPEFFELPLGRRTRQCS